MTPDWFLAAPALPGLPSNGGGGGGTPPGGPPGPGGPQPGAGGLNFLLPMILLFFIFMIFMQVMAGRKERKRRSEMMSTLRKHDKVRMLGGIIGTIAEVHDDEVILKVDESTNTRIRFAKDSVQSVLKPAPGSPSGEPEKVD